jgi:dihydrofolate reductase
MRNVIVSEFVTLDGVMEAPNQWSFQFGRDDEQLKYKFDELFASDALLLGRVTYQEFAAVWPTMPGAGEYGVRMNDLPKYVVSTTLKGPLEWNATLISDDLAQEVARLKQQPGQDILIFGSGDLIHSLRQQDLIDEYRLMVFPIVVGSGKRLFGDGAHTVLKLVDTKVFSAGVVLLSYQRA